MAGHLLRGHAPITETGWAQIDAEATERLTPYLAARKLVDFSGPHGWDHSATNLGHAADLNAGPPGGPGEGERIRVRQRRVLPLVEIRVPFTVSRQAVEDADRGAVDIDFADLDRAAKQAAELENRAVFHGWEAAGITGIVDAGAHRAVPLGDDPQNYPTAVARAVDRLRGAGIDGPYGLAIGPAGYTKIIETTEHGGVLLADHLRRILDGTGVWSPGLDGALVLSLSAGNFLFDSGQDLSVGYDHHDGDAVHLYLEESFTFRVAEPAAAIALTG